MSRPAYDSDLNDEQWRQLEPLLPPPKPGGRPRTTDLREVLNGVCYLARAGCAWRLLPHDFPVWSTVHYYYRRFRREGLWPKIHDALREDARRQEGREPTPSAAIIDSQSVKTTEKKGSAATTPARKSRGANVI
jgi:putative transposase